MKFILLGMLFVTTNVFAGQCEQVKFSHANKAIKLIQNKINNQDIVVIDKYCESCLDDRPSPIVVNNVSIKRTKQNKLASVLINNEIIDMAYIFIEGNNLAKSIGCNTVAVSAHF